MPAGVGYQIGGLLSNLEIFTQHERREAKDEREKMDKSEMGSPRIHPRPSVPIPRLIAWGGGGGAPRRRFEQKK